MSEPLLRVTDLPYFSRVVGRDVTPRVLERCEIVDEHGTVLGCVDYVRIRHPEGGSSYGWLPSSAPLCAGSLTTKTDAVVRMARGRTA